MKHRKEKNFSFCYQFTRKVLHNSQLSQIYERRKHISVEILQIIVIQKKIRQRTEIECETRKVVKKFSQIKKRNLALMRFLLVTSSQQNIASANNESRCWTTSTSSAAPCRWKCFQEFLSANFDSNATQKLSWDCGKRSSEDFEFCSLRDPR